MESQPQNSNSGLIPKTFTHESKGAKAYTNLEILY